MEFFDLYNLVYTIFNYYIFSVSIAILAPILVGNAAQRRMLGKPKRWRPRSTCSEEHPACPTVAARYELSVPHKQVSLYSLWWC